MTEEEQEVQIKEEDEDVKEMAKELGLEIEAPSDAVFEDDIEDIDNGENMFNEEDEELFEEATEEVFEEDLIGEV